MILQVAIVVGAVGLAVAATLCVVHLIRATTFADRMVATDLLLTIVVTGLVLSAIATRTTTLLPLAVVTALLGFVGTTAVARFIEQRGE